MRCSITSGDWEITIKADDNHQFATVLVGVLSYLEGRPANIQIEASEAHPAAAKPVKTPQPKMAASTSHTPGRGRAPVIECEEKPGQLLSGDEASAICGIVPSAIRGAIARAEANGEEWATVRGHKFRRVRSA
jgi:hypothetical protein